MVYLWPALRHRYQLGKLKHAKRILMKIGLMECIAIYGTPICNQIGVAVYKKERCGGGGVNYVDL